MQNLKGFAPCLWFDDRAEEAANFYCRIFKNSRITRITRYGKAGEEIHGRKPGTVANIAFELDGHSIIALNGGPLFKFNEAVSLSLDCRDQEEVDYYSERLTADGGEQGPCGWLKDKFGLSWQVVPSVLPEMLADSDRRKADRVMQAMLQMKKIDVAELQQAYEG
jgi:predicted 3-demethylubiquinone-9 3-methyltransferase (glyoxalase superfamily)